MAEWLCKKKSLLVDKEDIYVYSVSLISYVLFKWSYVEVFKESRPNGASQLKFSSEYTMQ